MESYQELLEKAYNEVKVIETNSDRFEIPKVKGKIQGKLTIITNFSEIASTLRREPSLMSKFLQKELATSGKIENDRLSLNSKLNSQRVNEKIEKFAKEFVICPECGKPDTELASEKHIKIKHCLACGAKSPIKYHL